MKYTRLYSDSDGETHFEDVEVEFQQRPVRPNGPDVELSAPLRASNSLFIQNPTGFFGDFHPTPRRQWFVTLAGIVEFGVSDGEVRRFELGDVILVDDVASKGHTSRVIEGGNAMLVGLEE